MKIILSSFILLFLSLCASMPSSKWPKLEAIDKIKLRIPEPSDICVGPDKKSFYIVSDNGTLFQTDLRGQILKKAKYRGADFEGVWYKSPYVHVADESLRQIILYDTTGLKKVASYQYSYFGARNKGWEGITWNPVRNRFVLFTERSPLMLFEVDTGYVITREEEMTQFAEVSSLTWHDNKLWILSDEERELYRVNPSTYAIETGWSVPVHNPEGVCFGPDGYLYVLSDDRAMLYIFPLPE